VKRRAVAHTTWTIRAAVLVLLLIGGCADPVCTFPCRWSHPGKSAAQFQLDEEQCQSSVQAHADGLKGADSAFNRLPRVHDCLRMRGYTEVRTGPLQFESDDRPCEAKFCP
jgi:hypothetical protein